MESYERIGWLDHVVDIITEEVIQEGTPVSQTNMNHMDDGIWQNRETIILHDSQIADAQREIKVLKDATLNNMVNNVFLINFVSDGTCQSGNQPRLDLCHLKRSLLYQPQHIYIIHLE